MVSWKYFQEVQAQNKCFNSGVDEDADRGDLELTRVNALANHLYHLRYEPQPQSNKYSLWSNIDTVDMTFPRNGSIRQSHSLKVLEELTLELLMECGINIRSWMGGAVTDIQFIGQCADLERLEYSYDITYDQSYEVMGLLDPDNFPQLKHLTLVPYTGEEMYNLLRPLPTESFPHITSLEIIDNDDMGCLSNMLEQSLFELELPALFNLTHLSLRLYYGTNSLDEVTPWFNQSLIEYLKNTPSLTSLSLPTNRPLEDNRQLINFLLQSPRSPIKRLHLCNMSYLPNITNKFDYISFFFDLGDDDEVANEQKTVEIELTDEMNKYFENLDISGLGKAIKNASKSVEKSLDDFIGVPPTGSTSTGDSTGNNDTGAPYSSDGFFGYSFQSPTKQQQQVTSPSPASPMSVSTTPPVVATTTPPSSISNNASTKVQSTVAATPTSTSTTTTTTTTTTSEPLIDLDEHNEHSGTVLDLSPIPTRRNNSNNSRDKNSDDDDDDDDDSQQPLYQVNNNSDNDTQELILDDGDASRSSKLRLNIDLDTNASFGADEDIDIPDIPEPATVSSPVAEAQVIAAPAVQPTPSATHTQTQVQPQAQPQTTHTQPQTQTPQTQTHTKELEEMRLKIKEYESKFTAFNVVSQEKDRVLGEREKQIQKLSTHGAQLQKTVDQLLYDISKLNNDQKKEDVENLKEEFSRRIGQIEKKLKDTQRERDLLKSGNAMSESMATTIKEKDDQIAQLMTEGTNLSHKVLQLESTVKKLRAQAKEHEETIQLMTDRIKTTEELLANKQDRLKGLEEVDKRYQDTLMTMKELTEVTTKKYEEKDIVAEKSVKQASELQSALEKAWKDISDLNKHHAIEIDRYIKQIDETKQKTRDEVMMVVSNERKDWKKREESLEMTIQEQKASLQRASERSSWKEEELTKEIQHLNQRCREAEQRNDQLGASIPDTTRPLIKQIEALQSGNEAKQQTWEALERSLQQQAKEARMAADAAIQNEQEALAELEELSGQIKQLELDVKKERMSNKQINAELAQERNKIKELETQSTEVNAKLDKFAQQKQQLERQVAQYEESLEKAYKDYREAEEMRQKEREIERERREEEKRTSGGSQSSYEGPATPKMYGLRKNPSQSDFLQQQHNLMQQQHQQMSPNSSFPMEVYQANITQKDGEIAILQSKLNTAESSRKKLEDQLIKLTSSNEQLLLDSKELKGLKTQVSEIQQRYSTALEMLGEKEEQVNELRMDIVDMKELYRNQVNELLSKIESDKR
ncbi:hypothetical protein SAMD00019534_001600 [Acytostelium subglobosum LB1]|uniref:hypothetical protein n=1 Tax=Acytostelium subglobosum LB1 TaxID=1410327 RepID=UPI000644BD93|nr:hypothetical protein SAMD00019534_001600 [Acytostelium subglobosum LB1]GAM16985.1 hypothetical protein SAMD00019534_001600 [Acytostelium subglobosum LB1]|eukprot:XP_012759047.1 hypothetical protein SAMD00019534_001600 [Acytostelium subglobosum LB1]